MGVRAIGIAARTTGNKCQAHLSPEEIWRLTQLFLTVREGARCAFVAYTHAEETAFPCLHKDDAYISGLSFVEARWGLDFIGKTRVRNRHRICESA